MISAIERGQQDPRLGTLDRLLRASGHEVDLVTLTSKGVDRGQIEGMLRHTAQERLAAVPGNTKMLRDLAGARDARGRRLHKQMVAPVLDIIGEAAGEFTYDNLLPNALSFDIGGFSVPVVSLDELIRMKRAAGRPKDHYGVANLTALRDVTEGRPEE
jgi:hypothetical protein